MKIRIGEVVVVVLIVALAVVYNIAPDIWFEQAEEPDNQTQQSISRTFADPYDGTQPNATPVP